MDEKNITDVKTTAAATPVVPPAPVELQKISIDDIVKIEIKVGKILSAEKIEKSDKLLKLSVDFAETAPRQILSGIAKHFPDPAILVGKRCMFFTNLASRQMMGLESNGMIMAVSTDTTFSLLEVPHSIPPGTRAK